MSLITSLSPYLEEIKLGALVLAAGGLFVAGYHLGGLSPKSALSALQAQDWQLKYHASQVALTAVQSQLSQAETVSANNSTVIQGLQDANAKTAADRDSLLGLYRGLLNGAAKHPASSPVVPASPSGPAVAGSSGTDGIEQAAVLLTDAQSECKRNSDRLDALIAQISPQLH